MDNFKQACENFSGAVSPRFSLDKNWPRVNDDIYKKLRKLWEKSNFDQEVPKQEDSGMGVCEIGHFTGNDLLRVLIDICKDPGYNQEKKFMYFNIKGQTKFVLCFVKTSVLTNHASDDNSSMHAKMYLKLFNDNKVEESAKKCIPGFDKASIQDHRTQAIDYFPNFLQNKIASFPLYPFGNAFISLLAKCAYRMSQLDGLRKRNLGYEYPVDDSLMLDKFENIPYPACIKFAFDAGCSGKISQLFGEGKKENEEKRQGAVKVAEKLIKSAFENYPKGNDVGEGLYDEEATKKIAKVIRKFYATPSSGDERN